MTPVEQDACWGAWNAFWGWTGWPELRGWLVAAGGGVALYFGISTYRLNARTRREEQARLVYSSPGSRAGIGAGSKVSVQVMCDHDLLDVPDPTNPNRRLAKEPLSLRAVTVHNDSKELIGPVFLDCAYTEKNGDEYRMTTLIDAMSPDSTSERTFARPEAHEGSPLFTVRFRDSSGQWWRRRGTEPIEAPRRRDRFDLIVGS